MSQRRDLDHFDDEDRRRQLSELGRISRELADLCADRHPSLAAAYAGVAIEADELLGQGFDQGARNELSSVWPAGPDWLHPKHPEYDAPWNETRQRTAALHRIGGRLAIDIRTIGIVGAPDCRYRPFARQHRRRLHHEAVTVRPRW